MIIIWLKYMRQISKISLSCFIFVNKFERTLNSFRNLVAENDLL